MADGRDRDGSGGHRGGPIGRGGNGRGNNQGGRGSWRGGRGGRGRGGGGGGRPNDGGQDAMLRQLTASVQQFTQQQQQLTQTVQTMQQQQQQLRRRQQDEQEDQLQRLHDQQYQQWQHQQNDLLRHSFGLGQPLPAAPALSPYQMAPSHQASAQTTPTQAQDTKPTDPETPEPTHSQGRSGRSYRVRKRKSNPPRRRPTAMERDESTSQRFSEPPHMGDEAATTEAAGGRQANEAEEEAEAREAAIEAARQERINAQQIRRTQLEGSRRSYIAGIDQETLAITLAQRDIDRLPSNNENLQRRLASLLPRIWRFRRFVSACANDEDRNLDQHSDPEEITEALDQFAAMVSLYWQEHVARYRRDAIRLSLECARLRNSNSG